MTKQKQNEVLRRIENLNRHLERWKHTPMLASVKEIGARAIRKELAKVAKPLRSSR